MGNTLRSNSDFAFYSVYAAGSLADSWRTASSYTNGYAHMFSTKSSIPKKYRPFSILINLQDMTYVMSDPMQGSGLGPVSDFVRKCDTL